MTPSSVCTRNGKGALLSQRSVRPSGLHVHVRVWGSPDDQGARDSGGGSLGRIS